MKRATAGTVFAVAAISAALGGCTIADSMKPVAGDRMNSVKFAAIDVLLEQKYAIAVAPVCSAPQPEQYVCNGETANNEKIAVTAPDETLLMTITVADREIFKGMVEDVLAKNGRVP